MWAIPTGTSSALGKKSGKESQFIVSLLELGSYPPIGSDRETGCDIFCIFPSTLLTIFRVGDAIL